MSETTIHSDDAADNPPEEFAVVDRQAEDAAPQQAETVAKVSILRRIWQMWLKPAPTQTERAHRSEQHFWLRVVVLLVFFGGMTALGILRVKQTSKGVRTAYDLVKTTEELRVQLEENRRLEARLTGLKNPNELRKEAAEHFDMHAPAAGDQEEVD